MDDKNRNIKHKVNDLLKSFPIVAILGVRQSGKSTLAKQDRESWKYFDLENPAQFELINNDPELFFREYSQNIIIDEAQASPKIFSVLRGAIDKDRQRNGRYILTGSASLELVKNISESLAGRVAIIELSPMKMNEILSEDLSSFFNIFNNKLSLRNIDHLKKTPSKRSLASVKKYLLKGGYPQPTLKNDLNYQLDWMENYFKTYVNTDVRSLFPRIDIIKYRRVIQMLSSLSGTIINKSEVARSVQSSEKSIRDYIEIIQGTFLWRELAAFKTSKIKTTISLPKGHYRDSGLMFFLQNITTDEELAVYPRLGNAFESFVVEEIIKGIESTRARNLTYSHFRTKAGAEIDLIVEGSFGLLPIEIKYSSNTKRSDIKSLLNFVELHELPYGLVINNCEFSSLITENIIQIPLSAI